MSVTEQSRRLNKAGAAEVLGVSVRMIDKLRREQALPCFKVGERVVFDQRELEEWLSRQRQIVTAGAA